MIGISDTHLLSPGAILPLCEVNETQEKDEKYLMLIHGVGSGGFFALITFAIKKQYFLYCLVYVDVKLFSH